MLVHAHEMLLTSGPLVGLIQAFVVVSGAKSLFMHRELTKVFSASSRGLAMPPATDCHPVPPVLMMEKLVLYASHWTSASAQVCGVAWYW